MKLDWFTVPRQLSSKQFRDYGLTLPESSGCAGMTLLTLLLLSSGPPVPRAWRGSVRRARCATAARLSRITSRSAPWCVISVFRNLGMSKLANTKLRRTYKGLIDWIILTNLTSMMSFLLSLYIFSKVYVLSKDCICLQVYFDILKYLIFRVGLRGGGGVGMGVSGMVFVGLVLGCIEAKFCK